MLETWLETPLTRGRHQRRIDKLAQIERELGIHIENSQIKK